MRVDRGEAGGTALALLLHAGLVVALTTSLARVPPSPEPPAMEVEFVDSPEVALTAQAPSAAPPPPASAPTPPQPQAVPLPAPLPLAPALTPQPAPRPAPPRPSTRPLDTLRLPPVERTSRLGDDFLKGIGERSNPARPAPAAATFGAEAKASVDQAIKRQIQPCADRQPALGAGAERIRVVLNLRLDRSGRLQRPPTVVRTSGVDADNERYEQPVIDQAIAVYRACSPLRLPPELYSTPQGGWGNINMTYRVP